MGDYVQIKHPLTDRYVKLDTRTGRIVATKRSPGPYANIPERLSPWTVMWGERTINIPGLSTAFNRGRV